jgi:hypothetical protein
MTEQFRNVTLVDLEYSCLGHHTPLTLILLMFQWGFLQDHTYSNRPQSISELKTEICRVADRPNNIGTDVSKRRAQNYLVRISSTVVMDGGHAGHVLK